MLDRFSSSSEEDKEKKKLKLLSVEREKVLEKAFSKTFHEQRINHQLGVMVYIGNVSINYGFRLEVNHQA